MTEQKSKQRTYPKYGKDSDLLYDVVEEILDRGGIPNTAFGPVERGSGVEIFLERRILEDLTRKEFNSICREFKATAAGLNYSYRVEGPKQGGYIVYISRANRRKKLK